MKICKKCVNEFMVKPITLPHDYQPEFKCDMELLLDTYLGYPDTGKCCHFEREIGSDDE